MNAGLPAFLHVLNGRPWCGRSMRGASLPPVSGGKAWQRTVRGTTEAYGSGVFPCTPHEAPGDPAAASIRYSHILVAHADADGFSGVPATIAAGIDPHRTGMAARGLAAPDW